MQPIIQIGIPGLIGGTFFGLLSYGILKSILKNRKNYNLTKQNNIYTIKEAIDEIKNSEELEKYICVRGNIYSNNYFKSLIHKNWVVYQQIQKTNQYQFDVIQQQPFDIQTFCCTKISIKDKNKLKIEIHQFIGDQLKNISKKSQSIQRKNNISGFSVIFSSINMISRLFSNIDVFQGVLIGVRTDEWTVALNAPVYIIGKVVYNKSSGIVSFDNVEYITQYISSLNQSYQIKKIVGIILFSITSLLAYYTGKNSFKNLYRFLKNKFRHPDRLLFSQSKKRLPQIIACDLNCLICKKNPNNILLKPCKHLCLCQDCFEDQNIKNCPQCYKEIQNHDKFFINQLTNLISAICLSKQRQIQKQISSSQILLNTLKLFFEFDIVKVLFSCLQLKYIIVFSSRPYVDDNESDGKFPDKFLLLYPQQQQSPIKYFPVNNF